MLTDQQIAERLCITSRTQLKRCTKLLSAIHDGRVDCWQDAIMCVGEPWGTVHRALKILRDAGLITTSKEYSHIAYKPEPKP